MTDRDADAADLAIQRAYVRRRALGGALHVLRTHQGQTIRQAAEAAGMSHMTWIRLEQGLAVKGRTLYALDPVLGRPTGTVARALEDDVLMLALLGQTGAAVTEGVAPEDAGAFLLAFVERVSTGAVRPAEVTTSGMTEFQLATALVERLRKGPPTSELERGVIDAALAAMPDLYARPHRWFRKGR